MKRAITEAKLKCRYCQTVFTGSTRLAPEVLPPEITLPVHVPQPEMTAPPYHPLPRRRPAAWQAGVVLLGLACAVVLGAWGYHYYQKQRQPVVSPNPSASSSALNPSQTTTTDLASAGSTASEAATGENLSPRGEAAQGAAGDDAAVKDTTQSHPVEVVEYNRLEGPEEASASFVGTYENHSPDVLRSVQVVLMVSRQDEKVMPVASEVYEAIPPGWRGQFSADADFKFEPGMRIGWVDVKCDPAPGLRGCRVEDAEMTVNDDETVRVTGVAKNTTDQPFVNPVVRCDFFTKQGLYVGSALGTFDAPVQTLAPGEGAAYVISFDPTQAGSSGRLIGQPQPRLLGTTNR